MSNEEKRWCAIEESDCPFAHRAKTRPNAQCCMKIKFVEFESKRLIQKIEVARRMCMCRELKMGRANRRKGMDQVFWRGRE